MSELKKHGFARSDIKSEHGDKSLENSSSSSYISSCEQRKVEQDEDRDAGR